VAAGALAVPFAVALVAAPGLAAAWLLLSGSPRAGIVRAMAAWLAASGVAGFAVGGWLAGRFAGAGDGRAVRLAVAAGAAALALVAATVLVGFDAAVDLRPAGVALGVVEPTPVVPPQVPGWVEATPRAVGPPERARERTLATIGYLVAAAGLSLGAAGLGGVMADRREGGLKDLGAAAR